MSGQDAFTQEAMEFLSLTSLRHIPAFFLGGVLIFALRSIMSSSLLERCSVLRPSNLFPPDPETISQEKAYTVGTRSTSMSTSPHDHRGLFFFLYLCFISASITFFASVLTFPSNAGGACAFVIAWSGITSQASRILGLVILFWDLRRLGVRGGESIIFLCFLVIGIVLTFVNTALATGSLRIFPPINSALCERKRSLPTSLALSMILIIMEFYTLLRLWRLVSPGFLGVSRGIRGLTDYKLLRASSLLVLELLTIIPSAVSVNIIADFVPYSLGALMVLAAFQFRKVDPDSRRLSMVISEPPSPVRSERPSYGRWSAHSRPVMNITASTPVLNRHPFSSTALESPSLRSEWIDSATARSSRTVDTSSIGSAIIQVAQRSKYPFSAAQKGGTPVSATYPHAGPSDIGAKGSLTRAIVPSQIALAESLGLETAIPPKARARPRLIVMTTSGYQDPQPMSIASPEMQALQIESGHNGDMRLTPTMLSPISASPDEGYDEHSMLSADPAPTSTLQSRRHSSSTTVSVHFSAERRSQVSEEQFMRRDTIKSKSSSRRNTFGTGRFRASGYSNPIQTRWSGTSHWTDRHSGRGAAPPPAPLSPPPPMPPLEVFKDIGSHTGES